VSARDAILEHAYALFVARGFKAVTVDELCAAARVTKGAFYHHWESKEALFRDLLMNWYLPELLTLKDACARQAGDPAADLRAVFRVMGESLRSLETELADSGAQFGAYYLLLEGLNHEPDFRTAVAAYYDDLARIVSDIIARGIESGVFKTGLDPTQEALAAIAEIEGAGILLLVRPGNEPVALMEGLGAGFLKKILAR
jgi:TetR/AcrR family transcriptional repressor of nem operon